MKLSSLQVRKFAREFQVLDLTGNGTIEWEDLARGVENLARLSGWAEDAPEREAFLGRRRELWRLLTSAADRNHDGRISLEEYVVFWARVLAQAGGDRAHVPKWFGHLIMTCFDALDLDKNGVIGRDDYARFLKAHGVQIDVDACFARLDHNGDGVISRKEGLELFLDFTMSADPAAPGNWLWGPIQES